MKGLLSLEYKRGSFDSRYSLNPDNSRAPCYTGLQNGKEKSYQSRSQFIKLREAHESLMPGNPLVNSKLA